jgi:hypothetical protein
MMLGGGGDGSVSPGAGAAAAARHRRTHGGELELLPLVQHADFGGGRGGS